MVSRTAIETVKPELKLWTEFTLFLRVGNSDALLKVGELSSFSATGSTSNSLFSCLSLGMASFCSGCDGKSSSVPRRSWLFSLPVDPSMFSFLKSCVLKRSGVFLVPVPVPVLCDKEDPDWR